MKWIYLVLAWISGGPLLAQELTALDTKHTRLVLDNERVRVYERNVGAGETVPLHSHPEYFVYAFSDGNLKITLADGSAKEINVKAGSASWNDPETHRVENIGTGPFRALYLELKPDSESSGQAKRVSISKAEDLRWQDAPRGFPKGLKIARVEGDPNHPGPFTMRMFFPAGLWIPAHRHTTNERMTVISGKIHLGFTERGEKAPTVAYGPGGFALIPAYQNHFAWVEEDTEVQVQAVGPWRVIFLKPPAKEE